MLEYSSLLFFSLELELGGGGEVSNIEHEGEVQKKSLGWEPFSFAKRPPLSHVAFFKFFFLEKKENHKTKK